MVTRTPPGDDYIPNSELPLLIYREALVLPEDAADFIEHQLATNRWEGTWRNGIYPYHHYHSTAHEVLVVYQGSARVQFGGDLGPIETLSLGDAVIIPAGVGHKKLMEWDNFSVVGAYPRGQDPDLRRGLTKERAEAVENIARVRLPTSDPLYGPTGILLDYWK